MIIISSLFLFLSFSILCIVLLQQGKGDIAVGGQSGFNTQGIFGGSGGMDFFSKLTWGLGFLFMLLALLLAKYGFIEKTHSILGNLTAQEAQNLIQTDEEDLELDPTNDNTLDAEELADLDLNNESDLESTVAQVPVTEE